MRPIPTGWTEKMGIFDYAFAVSPPPSPLPAAEILQIGWRLVLARRHELALGAEEIGFVAELDPGGFLCANCSAPERMGLLHALSRFEDRPRPRQSAVEHGDLVVDHILI